MIELGNHRGEPTLGKSKATKISRPLVVSAGSGVGDFARQDGGGGGFAGSLSVGECMQRYEFDTAKSDFRCSTTATPDHDARCEELLFRQRLYVGKYGVDFEMGHIGRAGRGPSLALLNPLAALDETSFLLLMVTSYSPDSQSVSLSFALLRCEI